MGVPGRFVAVVAACPVRVMRPPPPPDVRKFTLEAAVVAPNELKVRFAAAPLAVRITVPAPAVGVSAPRASVVATPLAPVNCKVPPALPVVLFALKVMAEVLLSTVEAAALAFSFKLVDEQSSWPGDVASQGAIST